MTTRFKVITSLTRAPGYALQSVGDIPSWSPTGVHGWYRFKRDATKRAGELNAAEIERERVAPGRLFNCCTDHAEPNWKEFAQLEIAGCRSGVDPFDNGEEITEGLQPARTAEFFTIYGRFHEPDNTCEAITDITDARDALDVAGMLALRSRLPVVVHGSLGG